MNFQALQECLQRNEAQGTFQNLALRIGQGNEILRDEFRGEGVDAQTVFDMASVTKIVATTTLTLIALDEKKLTLETKVSEFFPCPEEKRSMTIKHLLTHTMGIGHKNLCAAGVTKDTVADHILNIPSDLPIGADVQYSCPGYILLGNILERIYGQPLDQLFHHRVAKPLRMERTGFLPDRKLPIINHNETPEKRGIVNDYNCQFLGGVAGNAGIFSNLEDMTKYVTMLRNAGAPLFSREIFTLATKNHTPGMAESRGLGFLYVDERYPQTGSLFPTGSFGHCGHTGQSVFLNPDTGFYVIILSDATASVTRKYGRSQYGEVKKLREEIHNAIKSDLN